MTNIAVILAGGLGNRMGSTSPKQLLPMSDGRTVLEHAVDAFEQAPCIQGVIMVMHPDYMTDAEELRRKNAWTKVMAVVPGGRERWESSVHAIEAIGDSSRCSLLTSQGVLSVADGERREDKVNVLLHDAARPFVSQRIIADVCQALEEHEAVTVAVPATDTMYRLSIGVALEGEGRTLAEIPDRAMILAEIPDRATMMRAQTPQAFRLGVIHEAYQLALKDSAMTATDDCGIVHRYMPEMPIHIVMGEETNKKITYKEDL